MSVVGICMIAIAIVLENDVEVTKTLKSATNKINVINMSSSNRVVDAKIEDNDSTVPKIQ